MTQSTLLRVMTSAARKASRSLLRDFNEVEKLQVSKKGPGDFVTKADRKAEKIIKEELEYARPGYEFLLEEEGFISGSDKTHRWIIDPLDGTTNFLHGIPLFGISIALQREGKLVAGVVYNPIMDELFCAELGKGAFMNNQRLRVANRSDISLSIFGTGIPHLGRGDHSKFSSELSSIMALCSGVRRMGAASIDLCWLAAGRFDGFWERGLSPWDMAAGIIIIREAGGLVSDMDGTQNMLKTGHIIASNSYLHPQILKILNR